MTDLKFQIRPAKMADVDAIVRLVNENGPEGRPRSILPEELPQQYFATFQKIAEDDNQLLMVAISGEQIVGTFHMTFITYLAGAGCSDALVEAVHVRPDLQRQGIGSAMLHWAIQEASRRRCRRLQLTTDKRRTEAHKFYLQLGFQFSHEGAKLYLE